MASERESKRERVLTIDGPRKATVRTGPRNDTLPDGCFRVQTLYSGLSAGTELSLFRATNPFLRARWDPELGLSGPGNGEGDYPVRHLGYMEVARVIDSRTLAVTTDDIVAMAYGHRSGYRANPLTDRVVPLPDDLDPLLGIYVAHMGPICANGLLHAAAEVHGTDVRSLADGVRGRRVAVTGAGVIGLLTALFARRHGAEEVVLVDPTPERQAVGSVLGFEVLDPGGGDPAVMLKSRWRHAARDRGADVVFQCRGDSTSLALALRLLRPQGAVIDLAFYAGAVEAVRLGEEFHHNGLAIRSAQAGRVPRGTAHVWDRERLSTETINLLRAEHTAITKHVITDLVPIEHAPALLAELADRRRHVVQAVFTFE